MTMLDDVARQVAPQLAPLLIQSLGPQIQQLVDGAMQNACANLKLPPQVAAQIPQQPSTVKPTCTDGSCETSKGNPTDPCADYVPLVQNLMRKRCKAKYSECDAKRIAEAIRDSSWAIYEDQVGRLEMSFQLTNAIGPGQNGATPPAATTFVAGPTIPPDSSILLVQDLRYGLPWRPGCLDLDIAPPDGVTKENAYSGLYVTVFVALRSDLPAILNANPVTSYGSRWNDYQVIRGKELYCGDSCKSVDLDGPCVDGDWIGKDAVLIIQIDNTDNTNTVTYRNAEVKFRGVKRVCCDDCFADKSCSCKG